MYHPASALTHEDSYVGEDRRLGDKAIYSSVLRAVAGGDHRPSRIGGRLGRPQTSLSHVLGVLVAGGFLVNDAGLLSGRDPLYRIADEVVLFVKTCVEPWRSLVDDRQGGRAWSMAKPTWQAQVLGPHLERVARTWTRRFADPATLGGPPGLVGRAEIPDRSARTAREIDLVVLESGSRAGPDAQVLCIGEVKLTADTGAIVHLDRCAELLQARGHARPRKLLVIAESFTKAARAVIAARSDLESVDLRSLYDM